MFDVNEIAVFVSALLALALGSIWYSPLVFGRLWQNAAGLTDADLELTKPALTRSLVVALVGNTIVLFVIAHFVRFAAMYSFSRSTLILGIIALLAASMASMVVWEKRPFMYFVIHTGYAALVVIMGVVVISLWPW